MSGPESLENLASDLAALSPRQRREILACLTSFERVQAAALMRSVGEQRQAGRPEFEPFSPWLARRLETAHGGPTRDGAATMTDTARELLVKLAQDAVANQHILRTAIMRTSRPSLTAAIGRLLRPGSPSQ